MGYGAYIVIREQFRPEHAVVAIMRLLVGKRMESDCSYVVGADERDLSVSTGSEDLVQRTNRVHETRLNKVFCRTLVTHHKTSNIACSTHP
jgi:hypothetical protein